MSTGACGASATPTAAGKQAKATPPEVVLRLASGTEVRVTVEIAGTEAERTRGLMYRRSLDSGRGMLFLFPAAEPHKFWMRNTYIPLDMIFLAADRTVVSIEENAEPLTETPRGPDANTQFVLEVPGGWASTHGIEPGITARFVDVPGFAAP